MIDWILLLIAVFIIYLIVAWISHYDAGLLGSAIPDKLCIFCLFGKTRRTKKCVT